MSTEHEGPALFVSPNDFFSEAVDQAMEQRKVQTYPQAKKYIIDLLEHYMDARNLYQVDEKTGKRKQDSLAEMLLKADQEEASQRLSLLKRLGDTSLYISGFFGDSLNRKLVDIDYYAEMGGAAYLRLSDTVREDITAKVFREIAERFLEFVEVLTYVSQSSFIQTDQEVLRLYDRYLKTGSELAREKLHEMGVTTIPLDHAKHTKQN